MFILACLSLFVPRSFCAIDMEMTTPRMVPYSTPESLHLDAADRFYRNAVEIRVQRRGLLGENGGAPGRGLLDIGSATTKIATVNLTVVKPPLYRDELMSQMGMWRCAIRDMKASGSPWDKMSTVSPQIALRACA